MKNLKLALLPVLLAMLTMGFGACSSDMEYTSNVDTHDCALTKITLGTLKRTLQVTADSVKPESLEGIWQQVQVSKTDGHTMLLPVWKVLRSDGTFSTFLIVNRSGQSVITNEGTYKMVNDSTIVEHITGSITDPQLMGKDNQLIFRLADNDTLQVSYKMPGHTREAHEKWIRVKLERPRKPEGNH